MSASDNSEEISKNTKQSLAWFTLVPFAMHFIRFANSIVLARILDPDDFGIVGIVIVLLYFSNSLTEFGFSKAIIQYKKIDATHYNSYFVFNLIISVLLYLFFQYFSSNIALYFDEPRLEIAINVVTLIFLISSITAIPLTFFRRKIKYKLLAIAEIIKVSVSIVLSLSLALSGFEFMSIIYAQVISSFIWMFYLRFHSPIKPIFSFKLDSLKVLLKFSLWDFVWGQAVNVNDNIDKILIGRMLDVTQLGFYEKAQGLARMPYEQFAVRLGMVSFSTFSRIQHDTEELRNYFSKMMVVNAFFCFPFYVGLLAVSEKFVLVLLGNKWAFITNTLEILTVSFLILSIMGPIVSLNTSIGKIKPQTLLKVGGVFLLVILLLMNVHSGIEMVGYVLVLVNAIVFILSFILLKMNIAISFRDLVYCLYPAIISSFVLYLSVVSIESITNETNLTYLLIMEIVAGVIGYSLCVLFLPFNQWAFIKIKFKNKVSKVIKIK